VPLERYFAMMTGTTEYGAAAGNFLGGGGRIISTRSVLLDVLLPNINSLTIGPFYFEDSGFKVEPLRFIGGLPLWPCVLAWLLARFACD